MKDDRIQVGSVVQINEHHDPGDGSRLGWVGCFVLVTELKSFGVMGFVGAPQEHSKQGQYYIRLKWEEIDYIGEAKLMPQDVETSGD